MKITRIKNNVVVVLESGLFLSHNNCSDEMYQDLVDNRFNEEVVKGIMVPNFMAKEEEYRLKQAMIRNLDKSEYLTAFDGSFYVTSISNLSLPEDLAVYIYKAEMEGDQHLLSTYLNFWTLTSLNPDSEARKNLFWFLTRYGMTISRSGLFVAYRNVVVKKASADFSNKWIKFITDSMTKVAGKKNRTLKEYFIGKDSDGERICTRKKDKITGKYKGRLDILYSQLSNPDAAPVYTDGYTGKFTIRIGEPVTMNRASCDSNQNNTCSRGLHVAGKSWLQSNYFGNTGLRVLVNPADVVAVPPQDSYGKMRVCAYYPVAVVDFDEEGNIVDEDIQDGFFDSFIDKISYKGTVNNKEENAYKLNIPEIPEISEVKVEDRLKDIKASMKIKTL